MIVYVLIILNIATPVLCAAKIDVDTLPIKNFCKLINTTDYSTCLKESVEESFPQVSKGIPEIDFPPLDPFLFEYGNGTVKSGEIYGEVSMYNVTIIGFKNTRFLDLRPYIYRDDKYGFNADIFMPKLIFDGGCTAVGSLGGIRMGGVGRFNATAENIRTAIKATAHAENDTLILDHVHVIPVIDKLKVHVWDYFEGIEEFNELLETFINDFWPTLYRLLLPRAIELGDEWLTNFCNPFLSRISISQIFP